MTNSSSSSLPSITTLNNANVFVKQEPNDADQLLKRQQHHMQQQQQQQQHNTGKTTTYHYTLTSMSHQVVIALKMCISDTKPKCVWRPINL